MLKLFGFLFLMATTATTIHAEDIKVTYKLKHRDGHRVEIYYFDNCTYLPDQVKQGEDVQSVKINALTEEAMKCNVYEDKECNTTYDRIPVINVSRNGTGRLSRKLHDKALKCRKN